MESAENDTSTHVQITSLKKVLCKKSCQRKTFEKTWQLTLTFARDLNTGL